VKKRPAERDVVDTALGGSGDFYRAFAEAARDPFFVIDLAGTVVFANPAAAKALSKNPDDLVGKKARALFPAATVKRQSEIIGLILQDGAPRSAEMEIESPQGVVWYDVNFVPLKDGQGRPWALQGIGRDITERKRVEANLLLATEALKTLNRGNAVSVLVEDLISLIKRETRLDAVGLRLRRGEDYPYFMQKGFSEAFLREENSLGVRGRDAAVVRDETGRPVLECLCGLVISGRTDPALPFFTPGGSFWTNAFQDLPDLDPGGDPRSNPRNGCLRSGYESVALIPLRSDGETVGLLQLNDRRPGRFTGDIIRFFEGLAESLGAALTRSKAEEALSESAEKFTYVFEHSPVGKSITLCDGKVNVNNALAAMLGYSLDEINQKRWQDLTPAEDIELSQRHIDPLLSGEKDTARFLKRYLHKNGSIVWGDVNTSIRRDRDGRPLYFMTTVIDVTERKKAEERIVAQLEELRRWHEATVGREKRILELKREVNELLVEAGRPARYPSAVSFATGPSASRPDVLEGGGEKSYG